MQAHALQGNLQNTLFEAELAIFFFNPGVIGMLSFNLRSGELNSGLHPCAQSTLHFAVSST